MRGNLISKIKNQKKNHKFTKLNQRILFDVKTENGNRGAGDLLLTTAIIRAIHQKFNLPIDYLVREEMHVLFRDNPYIDRLITQANPENYKICYQLKMELEDYSIARNRQERIDSMAELFDLELENKIPEIYIPKQKTIPNSLGITIESTGYIRRWKYEYVEKLIEKIKDYYNQIYIFGLNDLYPLNDCIDRRGKTDLESFIKEFSAMETVLTVDSFSSHLAAAYNIPSITLYTEIPKEWRSSYYHNTIAIQSPCSCSPCWARQKEGDYHCNNKNCINALTPDLVKTYFLKFKDFQKIPLIEISDGLGDVITSLPLAKYFGLTDYKVKEKYKSIFNNLSFINNVYSLSDNTQHKKRIVLSNRLSNYSMNRIDATFKIAKIKNDNISKPKLILTQKEKDYGKQICKKRHWLKFWKKKPSIVIAPVSTFNSTCYTKENLRYLIKKLNDKYHVIIVHNKKIDIDTKCTNLTGKTNIRELLGIIWACDLVITVDTSILHIAGSLGKKFILLVSTMPSEWQLKYYDTGIFIKSNMDCCPCAEKYPLDRCKKINTMKGNLDFPSMPCMMELKPERIIEKCDMILH